AAARPQDSRNRRRWIAMRSSQFSWGGTTKILGALSRACGSGTSSAKAQGRGDASDLALRCVPGRATKTGQNQAKPKSQFATLLFTGVLLLGTGLDFRRGGKSVGDAEIGAAEIVPGSVLAFGQK